MARFGWFKFYTEALYDVKLAPLTDSQWRCWWSLVALARESSEPGCVRMSAAQIAWKLHKDDDWVCDGVAACEGAGLVTQEPGVIRIVQFAARQAVGRNPEPAETVAERKRRQRERDAGHDVTQRDGRDSHADVTTSRTLEKRREEKRRVTTGAAGDGSRRPLASKARRYQPDPGEAAPVPKSVQRGRR